MPSDEPPETGHETGSRSTPEQFQNVSTEEFVESGHEAAPSRGAEDGRGEGRGHHDAGAIDPPGQTRHDDSIDASSDDPGGSPHVDAHSVGYDSPTATRIGDEEADDGDTERLRELHEGRHRSDGELSTRMTRWDKTRTAEAICSALPLAGHEREKVLSVVETLDFSRFGQQRGLEGVTLGVITVVVDEHHRQRDDVDGDIVTFTHEYGRVRDSVDVSMSDLGTIKEIVREALEEGSATMSTKEPRRDPLLPEPTSEDEYPREFWDRRTPGQWAGSARNWSRLPEEFKEAVPDDYRDLIENLRRWEPWAGEEDTTGSGGDAEQAPTEPTNMDGVMELAEELVDEMSDESTE